MRNLETRFAKAAPDALRVVVQHHPLLLPEGPMQKPMRRVDHADRALETFGRLGVRLVLSGHFHLSYVRRHENPGAIRQGEPAGPRQAAVAPILVVQASSTISTRLRGKGRISEADLDAMHRLRCGFDPDGRCNPGKVFPTPRLCGEVPGPYRQHPLEREGVERW